MNKINELIETWKANKENYPEFEPLINQFLRDLETLKIPSIQNIPESCIDPELL